MESTVKPTQLMIVKNEAGRIKKALTWGEGLFAQRIVVDTGSLDRTMEIASSLGAQVHQIKWEDDFSAARNAALMFCPDGWVVFTDADEYMSEEDAAKIPRILEEADASGCNGIVSAWMQLDDNGSVHSGGSVVRIFRKNGPDMYYRRRIHEQLECRTGLHLLDASDTIAVMHTGYQKDAMTKKLGAERNRELIQKELDNNPEDDEMLGYLGDEYYVRGDLAKAESLYKSSIACMKTPVPDTDQRAALTYAYLLEILEKKQGAENELYEYYDRAVSTFPTEPDFDYILGTYLEYTGDYERAVEMYERAIAKIDATGTAVHGICTVAALPQIYEEIAFCCSKSGDYPTGERAARQLLSNQKNHYKALVACMVCQKGLCEDGGRTAEACAKIFDIYYERRSLRDQMLLYRASCDAGFEQLRLLLRERFTPDEQANLDCLFPVTGVASQ
jgi:tetratricopeptide (TPR) repeat protein